MKIGILADVHGNLEALMAVMCTLRGKGATRFICCGDIVGYGPDPNRCIETMRGMDCVAVAGNHDYAAAGKTPTRDFNSDAANAILWTRDQLTETSRLYLENLPLTYSEEPLFIVHSLPSAPDAWRYALTLREAVREMKHYADHVCVVGHSHRPLAVERLPGKAARLFHDDVIDIRPGVKYFLNAGSVGQPRDGDPRACALLYDAGNRSVTRLRVPYDVAAVQAKMRAAGLSEFGASRLETGR